MDGWMDGPRPLVFFVAEETLLTVQPLYDTESV